MVNNNLNIVCFATINIQCNPLISAFFISTFPYIDLFSNYQMKVFLIYILLLHYIYISTFLYRHKNLFPTDVDISGLHCTLAFLKRILCLNLDLNVTYFVYSNIQERIWWQQSVLYHCAPPVRFPPNPCMFYHTLTISLATQSGWSTIYRLIYYLPKGSFLKILFLLSFYGLYIYWWIFMNMKGQYFKNWDKYLIFFNFQFFSLFVTFGPLEFEDG